MRLPVQLRVPLRASRSAVAYFCALPLVAFGLQLTLPAPWWFDVCAAAVVVVWAAAGIRAHGTRTSRTAVTELMLSSDAVIVVRRRDGRLVAGHVRASSYVEPWFTSIVWRPDGARRARCLPILPDMLDVDDFRRLRVLLRYGRREVAAGMPASQA